MIPDTIEYQEAMALAEEGFAIFPLHKARVVDDKGTVLCTCGKDGCTGKHPRVPFSEWATSNRGHIHQYWSNHPDASIGVHLGKSHCFAIDVDGSQGLKEWNDILDSLGLKIPVTRTVQSGRADGGIHYYFARWTKPAISSGILSPNVHVKGNAGHAYVVAPPSLHVSGNRYSYVNRIAPLDADPDLIKIIQSKNVGENHDGDISHRVTRHQKPFTSYEIPLTRLLSPEQIGKLHEEQDLIIGMHPVHPTQDSPREFSISKKYNRWRCWWHGSGGGLLELAAMLTGLCKCDEFTKDNLIKPISGRNFARSIAAAYELGISAEEIEKYLRLMPS
jgi:hypothetical protein